MEGLVETGHGPTVLIAGLVIVLCLHLVVKFLEIGLKIFQKKSEATDQTKIDVIRLEHELKNINKNLRELLKLKDDVNNAFTAIKIMAGKKWPEISKRVREDRLG